MDKETFENLTSNLRKGLNAAASRAEEVAKITRARLDIALTKKQIHRTQAALGAYIHKNFDKEDLGSIKDAGAYTRDLDHLNSELKDREEALSNLISTQPIDSSEEETT